MIRSLKGQLRWVCEVQDVGARAGGQGTGGTWRVVTCFITSLEKSSKFAVGFIVLWLDLELSFSPSCHALLHDLGHVSSSFCASVSPP